MALKPAEGGEVVQLSTSATEPLPSICISVMASVMDTDSPRSEKTSWSDFRQRFKKPEIRGDVPLDEYLVLKRTNKQKAGALKDGACYCPATFRPAGRRCDADVDKIYLFVGDLDNDRGPTVTQSFIGDRLAGLEYLAHTSYSHSTLCEKWRVVISLKRPVTASEYPAVFASINNLLDGELDPKGKTPSQPYFLPSCPPDAFDLYAYFHCTGDLLDPDQLLNARVAPCAAVFRDARVSIDIDDLHIADRIKKVIRSGQGSHYPSRSEAVYGVVSSLIRAGCNDAEIISICTDGKYGISEKPLEQKNPIAFVERALKKLRQTPDHIKEMNQKHAVVMVAGKCVILNEEIDPISGNKGFTLSSPTDIRTLYANRRVSVDDTLKTITDVWLTHPERRQYTGIVFAPSQETPGYYNLWRGFAVEPIKGNCDLFIAHIYNNIARCDDEIFDYVINWLADAVQNPAERPGTSLVLRGKQGTGKGIMASGFGSLFGAHFRHVQHARHLIGHFNSHLKDTLIIFADEAFWAGDRANAGALKAMITEESLPIEFKGKDVIYVKNYVRLIVASNSQWVVPAGLEERRFFVVDVGEAHMQDTRYFEAIIKQMNSSGREALLHYLLNEVDLTDIDLREFPQTDALREQKLLSMGSVDKFWFEVLSRGSLSPNRYTWTGEIPTAELHDEYVEQTRNVGQSHKSSQTELGIRLKQLCPQVRRVRRVSNSASGRKESVYDVPSLDECRRAFETATKCEWTWPQEDNPELPLRHGKGMSLNAPNKPKSEDFAGEDQPAKPDPPKTGIEAERTGLFRQLTDLLRRSWRNR